MISCAAVGLLGSRVQLTLASCGPPSRCRCVEGLQCHCLAAQLHGSSQGQAQGKATSGKVLKRHCQSDAAAPGAAACMAAAIAIAFCLDLAQCRLVWTRSWHHNSGRKRSPSLGGLLTGQWPSLLVQPKAPTLFLLWLLPCASAWHGALSGSRACRPASRRRPC